MGAQEVKTQFDVIVVGAGINGAGIARDAAMRGLKVCLVDKGDIASGTSSFSTRLIHGGLRYLEHAEFGLVRESLRERETLLKIAPHLVRPIGILIPVYRHSRRGLLTIRAGMIAYDLLSVGKTLPRHKMLSREEVLGTAPGLDPQGLLGGASYSDCQVEYAERLVVENALSAREHGAVIHTYCSVNKVLVESGFVQGVDCTDVLSGQRIGFSAPIVVNASGPWVDSVLVSTGSAGEQRLICGTKGSHIIVRNFPGAPKNALYVEAQSDARPFFIIPWNELFLIGTTDLFYNGDLDHLEASTEEIDYLISETNGVVPSANLTREKVLSTYSGVRPLPCIENERERAITRRHIIYDHSRAKGAASAVRGLVSIIGGKLTTYRSLAQQAVDLVFRTLGRTVPECRSADEPLPGAAGRSFPEFANQFKRESVLSLKTKVHLLRVYGVRAAEIETLAKTDERLREIVDEDSGAIAAEVEFVLREEMVRTKADVIDRRAMVGLGPSRGRHLAGTFDQTFERSR